VTNRAERLQLAIVRVYGLSALTLLLAACAGDRAPSAEPPAVRPAAVSAEQFASLTWLSGRWRGAEPGGTPFFEAYVPLSASRIRTYTYPDSAFATPSDSGLLELRGDTLFSGSPSMQWVATQLDSARVEFAPWRGASNRFVWLRTADGAWTATLQWDSAGTPMQRAYEMKAVP